MRPNPSALRRVLRTRTLVLALPFTAAAAAFAAQVNMGEVLTLPQDPFSAITVIGVANTGSVTVDGGTQATFQAIALGGLPPSEGTLTVTGAGSKVTTTGDPDSHANAVAIGFQGKGTVTVQQGGAIALEGGSTEAGNLGAAVALGVSSGSEGHLTVTGAGSRLDVTNGAAANGAVAVAVSGDGTLEVSDGGVIHIDTGTGADGGFAVGNDEGTTGTATLTGAGSMVQLEGEGTVFTAGLSGTGVIEVANGASVTGAQIGILGLSPTGDGTLRVSSGGSVAFAGKNPLLGVGGALSVGLSGTGRLEVTQGTVTMDDPANELHGLQLGGATGCGGACPGSGGTGTVVVDGGTVQILGPLGGAAIGADGVGSLTIRNGGSFQMENPDDASGVTVGAEVGSTGSVLVTGAGSSLDAGAGLLAGLTLGLADAGDAEVIIENAGTLLAQSLTLGSGGVLRGDGHVNVQNVMNLRGTLAPGAALGALLAGTGTDALVVGGDVTQTGGTFQVDLASSTAGSFGQLAASGALALQAGAIALHFVGGFRPASGDEVVVATAAGGVTLDPSVTKSYSGAAPGFSFEVVAEGNNLIFRALSDAEGFGACQAAQLKAFSNLCKKQFGCHAAYAKKSAKDPGGAKRDECLAGAEAGFAKSDQKALDAAAQKGETCGATAPPAEADDALTGPIADVVAGVLEGWTPGASKDDDALRASLLGSSGTLCGALLGIESKQAKKHDEAKRTAARGKAATQFESSTQKALDKATGKGVEYGGTALAELGTQLQTTAAAATGAAAGIAP